MVRTRVQLTESQAEGLKRLAERWHISMAEVVRRSVELMLDAEQAADDETRRRAAAAVGAFRSGGSDVSETHDAYLVQMAFR